MIPAIACALLLTTGPAPAANATAADTLARQLHALIDRRDYVPAGSLAREALPRLLGAAALSDPPSLALADAVLEALARGMRPTGAEAETLAAHAEAARRGDADSLALANTLLQSGRLLMSRWMPRPARARFEEGLRLTLAHAPGDSSALEEFDVALGAVSLPLLDAQAAERWYRAALAIEERRHGLDDPASARVWLGLGITTAFNAAPAEGRAHLEHALALVLRQVPPDPAVLTSTLTNLTHACTASGEWPDACRYGERAVAATDSLYGPGHVAAARAHLNLADALACVGDRPEALRHARRAVAIDRAAQVANTPDLGAAIGVCGEIFYDSGVLDSASVYLREQHTLYRRLFGADHPAVMHVRGRIAVIESERGHPSQALAWLRSLPAGSAAGDHDWGVELDRARARVFSSLGRAAQAESLYRVVALAHDSLEGPRSPFTLSFRGQHAECLYDLGLRARAFREALDVQRLSRDVLEDAAARLSDREALGFEDGIVDGSNLLLTLAADPRGLAPADRLSAWDALCHQRLALLETRAERRRLARGAGPASAARQAELTAARDSLARLVAIELASGGADAALAQRIDHARRAREAAERALGETSPAYRSARAEREAGIAEAIAALPPDAALVGFVRYGHRRPPVPADSGLAQTSESRYAAFVKAPGRADVEIVPLGTATAIEEPLGRWIERCAHPIAAADTVTWNRFRALGTRVRSRVWDPVAAKLGGADRVFVVPDGMLAGVDLLALPSGRDGWLAESGPALDVLGTERDLVRDAAPAPAGGGLLAFGDPAFDALPADAPAGEPVAAAAPEAPHSLLRDAGSPALPRLPGSASEVRMLDSLWRGLGADHGGATTRLGTEASEEAFKALAPGRRVLHLATHGVSLAGLSITLAPRTRGVGGLRPERAAEDAESRDDLAALALAGAARHDTTSARDDGWLTSEEVLALDLSGVDWAVLSACESGVSDPRARESVQGLVRSFRLAGARTVLASLWPVDDAATREWMARVYQAHWRDGLATPDAVRAACRETIAARRARGESTHPFYWGAFVATGAGN